MAYEHEIPKGGRLYFGALAAAKREIENKAVEIFVKEGFEEISTPYFTYQKHQTYSSQSEQNGIIRLSDTNNNAISLRADSSIDVVRLITKRLGRSTTHKKWFYIQPVFHFPTTEINQIGAEFLDSTDVSYALKLAGDIFAGCKLAPKVQISDIAVVKAVVSELKLDFELFMANDYAKLKKVEVEWFKKLLDCDSADELKEIVKLSPKNVSDELGRLIGVAEAIGGDAIVAPLYVPKSSYYTDVFFRMLIGNDVVARGGNYKAGHKHSCGFAIYTDNIIQRLSV